ncbi:energy-coupling factor ABC transporter permease [Mycolicibacterium brumae]|uniref:Cobalamin biosynthesis protein CbiM n=2 Tax=Mycolicibacterium brumae TaxID=85968 RepID=A0A2G5P5D3_9MYCO|nr:energy-coupling factor ABC transporter permease [Mycolicibacterium brumae]PIB73542.1 cobalamin biosynthesis protein CbiM [Mycolicibacterium brumae]
MHMGNGIVNSPTCALFGVIALLAIGFSAVRARAELTERTAEFDERGTSAEKARRVTPAGLAALVTAFIFATQMVNFPILPGVSGHLLGGTLAAILVGPYTAVLCVSVVLTVQSVLFADGGLTALGANIVNMAVIGVAAGYGAAVLLARRFDAGRSVGRLGAVAFVAAAIGTVCASMGVVIEYAIGGAGDASPADLAGYLLGTHLLIGVGEGVITALTVMTVARTRPDLIFLTGPAGSRQAVPA